MMDTILNCGITPALAAADRYDRLIVRGTPVLAGEVALALNLSFDPADFVDSFLVLENAGTSPIDLISGSG